MATPEGPVRPDLVVRLAGGKNIVVDSKVSLAAYLEAAETDSDEVRSARLEAHARHLRDHVDQRAAKAYWTALSPSPEFVILFITGEAFLAPALERDAGLLEYAIARKVQGDRGLFYQHADQHLEPADGDDPAEPGMRPDDQEEGPGHQQQQQRKPSLSTIKVSAISKMSSPATRAANIAPNAISSRDVHWLPWNSG